MTLTASLDIPTFEGTTAIKVEGGSSVIFIGANGAGKTRLGVYLDKTLSEQGIEVHRIAAHRSLKLNPNVIPPSLEIAENRLFYGYEKGGYQYKPGHRFSSSPETALLDD